MLTIVVKETVIDNKSREENGMIVTETYTLNNTNTGIREAVTLYSSRDPTEEELFYINMHTFESAYMYAKNKGWEIVGRDGGKQTARNISTSSDSRTGFVHQAGKSKTSEKGFSATGAILSGGICVVLAIVLLPVLVLNDGSVMVAMLLSMGLSYLGVWFCKQVPKEYQDKIAAEEQELIKHEYQQALDSQHYNEPWTVRYATYPCPYCGHYKVRSAKWEDKQLSVAFWGIASSAIGKEYKCEHCKNMW